MTIPRGRQEPDYPTNIPGMIWGQGPELNAAMIAEIDRETRGVDMMFYRLTVPEIVDALIRKQAAGVPVRVFAEPTQYRNDKWPEFWLVGAMVDRLIAAGIPVKQRSAPGLDTHQGDDHVERRAERVVQLRERLGARSQLLHYGKREAAAVFGIPSAVRRHVEGRPRLNYGLVPAAASVSPDSGQSCQRRGQCCRRRPDSNGNVRPSRHRSMFTSAPRRRP